MKMYILLSDTSGRDDWGEYLSPQILGAEKLLQFLTELKCFYFIR